MSRAGRALRGLGLTAAATHLAPLATAAPPLRRWWPRLSGFGDPTHVALTFDDGPDTYGTPAVLDALADCDVRATFFVLGTMIAANPQLVDRIAAQGHEIAVHGWDHRSHVRRSPHVVRRHLASTLDAITRRTGKRPQWFRPPYGLLTAGNLAAARRLHLQPVLWTADGRDWTARTSSDKVATRVLREITGGATVLLHDSDCTSAPGSWRHTAQAIPAIVRGCRELGLTLGPLAEHSISR